MGRRTPPTERDMNFNFGCPSRLDRLQPSNSEHAHSAPRADAWLKAES